MKQSHYGIYIGTCEEDGGNRGPACAGRGIQFGRCKYLVTKIRRGVQKKPVRRIGRKRHLSLSARSSLQNSSAQPATVRTNTIPLRETAPGCRAEDLNAH